MSGTARIRTGLIFPDRAEPPADPRHGVTSVAHAKRKDEALATPTFGIFDHIEEIPGTPTDELFRDRLELIRLADEAGFEAFHLAEHHGSGLCLAPNQELFIAAASQVTTRIRLGPMVKLLPFHHPVRILEDMCAADQLTGGRLDFGVGSGAAPIEHAWFGSDWRERRERFEDTLRIVCRALATGEISSEGSTYYDFPTAPLATKPVQDPIPFWYPGNPATAGRYGMSLMWPGPIDQQAYDVYVEAWNEHKGDSVRFDGSDSQPRVGCTMIVAIAPTEREALDIGRRAMDGLVRRTEAVHQNDRLIMSPEDCEKAIAPLRAILAHAKPAVAAGSGTADQIAERFAAMLEPGLIEHVNLQIPTGDMTYDEARRTFELFASDVKPQLEKASLAA